MKSYFKGSVEFLSGEGVVLTEFIGEVATRQINILDGERFSSSSLYDKNDKIGYLLYDGKKSDLDLSDSVEIRSEDFEREWLLALEMDASVNDVIFLQGDATVPVMDGVMIVHIVNNLGKWGKGFVLSLSKRYYSCRDAYLSLYENTDKPKLGYVQIVCVDNDKKIYIGNMFAQDGIKKNKHDSKRYVSYDALSECLAQVAEYCLINRIYSVQMPLIGTGLAGGNWDEIQLIVERELCYKKIKCYVISL